MTDKRRGLSRRGLFGLFGRGLQDARRAAAGEEPTTPPPAPPVLPRAPATPPAPVGSFDAARDYECVTRPAHPDLRPEPHGPGSWLVHLGDVQVEPGTCVKLDSGDLPEAIVLVRVLEYHWAACASECPVDASDVVFDPESDRLVCPGCGTAWRLDGAWTDGPADYDLAGFVVTAHEGVVRILQP